MDTKTYGCKKDEKDFRDYKYVIPQHHLDIVKAAKRLSLKSKFDPVYDQGQLGSCTANGLAGVVQYLRKTLGLAHWIPSRLFIYYLERALEGTISQDSGAAIRDGIKALAKWGVCPEILWPYDISKFTDNPSTPAYGEAALHTISAYYRVEQTLAAMKSALVSNRPIVIGFSVYESFESKAVAATGIVPMPGTTEAKVGDHCVVVTGFDDDTKMFENRNSWNFDWGQEGYFTIPYDYFLNPNLASDLWIIVKDAR